MACSMAALMKPSYSSGPSEDVVPGDAVAVAPILVLVGIALLSVRPETVRVI